MKQSRHEGNQNRESHDKVMRLIIHDCDMQAKEKFDAAMKHADGQRKALDKIMGAGFTKRELWIQPVSHPNIIQSSTLSHVRVMYTGPGEKVFACDGSSML